MILVAVESLSLLLLGVCVEKWLFGRFFRSCLVLFSSGKDCVYCGCGTTSIPTILLVTIASVAVVTSVVAAGATAAAAAAAAAATAAQTEAAAVATVIIVVAVVEGSESATTAVCLGCWVRRRAVNFTSSIILARAVVSASWPAVARVQLDLIGEIVVQVHLRFLGYCIFGNGLES